MHTNNDSSLQFPLRMPQKHLFTILLTKRQDASLTLDGWCSNISDWCGGQILFSLAKQYSPLTGLKMHFASDQGLIFKWKEPQDNNVKTHAPLLNKFQHDLSEVKQKQNSSTIITTEPRSLIICFT